jgi:hypothetical protein
MENTWQINKKPNVTIGAIHNYFEKIGLIGQIDVVKQYYFFFW